MLRISRRALRALRSNVVFHRLFRPAKAWLEPRATFTGDVRGSGWVGECEVETYAGRRIIMFGDLRSDSNIRIAYCWSIPVVFRFGTYPTLMRVTSFCALMSTTDT